MLQARRRAAFGTAGSMEKGHAVTAIVGDHDARLGPDHLRPVVLDELLVTPEAVSPPRWLVREPIPGEVQRADVEAGAQLGGDFKPVDAARWPAVYQQQHR